MSRLARAAKISTDAAVASTLERGFARGRDGGRPVVGAANVAASPPVVGPRPERVAWFISRQRLVGRTNGSSSYLLDLAQACRRAGLTPQLLAPSPVLLGRWPVLRLKPEMKLFAEIRIRGVWRLGPLIFARDPRVYARALRAVAAAALARLGAPTAWLGDKPSPYASAAPWSDADRLYVANVIRGRADVLIADYAWQTEGYAYALAPGARTAVVMHDLWHARAERFGAHAAADPLVVDRATELRLLGRAQAIIAIQKTEAQVVARALPHRTVLTAPMTAKPAPAPQPGDARTVLFVGSNAAANVSGLAWMLERVWPRVLRAAPDAKLLVAGAVSRADRASPAAPGVRRLGFVGGLDRLYARAGVVVSPLIAGSGLKIKLVEALAHGKACVVTSVTMQGVEGELADAVALADAPEDFAAEIVRLLSDDAARAELGARALAAIGAHFSAEVGHADIVAWLTGANPS
jgi:succinoglycan biosynthesis protein ExoO